MTFGIFSVLLSQIHVVESYLDFKKIYGFANFYCCVNFSIVLGQISFRGMQTASGRGLPLWKKARKRAI